MKAVFSEGPISTFPEGKMSDDTAILPYVYQGSRTGQNYLVISQPGTTGDFRMCIHGGSGRFVKLLFNDVLREPASCLGKLIPYAPRTPILFIRQSKSRLKPHIFSSVRRGNANTSTMMMHRTPWTELIPMENYLNFTTMRMGKTGGLYDLGNTIRFRTKDNSATGNRDESQDEYGLVMDPQYYLVKATDWGGNGVLDWILTQVCGDLKVKEADGTYQDYPYGTVLRQVVSSGRGYATTGRTGCRSS